MLKEPQEIIQTLQDEEDNKKKKQGIAGIIRSAFSELTNFFNSLGTKITSEINSNTFDVRITNQKDFPDVQKISGDVTIKESRDFIIGIDAIIDSLNSVKKEFSAQTSDLSKSLKQEKTDLSPIIKAIKAINIPETKIPKYPESISVNNLKDLEKLLKPLLEKIEKKEIKFPSIEIPKFPKAIEISNFPDPKDEAEEDMTGFYWNKNENGDVTEIVEQYPSGDIVSTGWAIGRIKIDDRRTK